MPTLVNIIKFFNCLNEQLSVRIFNIPKENNIFEFSNKYTNFFFVSFSIYFCRSNERNKIFFKHFSFTSRHINYAIILPRTVTLKIRLEYFYILRSLFPSLRLHRFLSSSHSSQLDKNYKRSGENIT